VLGNISEGFDVTWEVVDSPELTPSTKEKLGSLDVSIIRIPGRGPTETTVIRPLSTKESVKALPCISILHGGPHSSITQSFTPSIVAQALDGYLVSIPNYTGTPGYGEENLQALIGNCGSTEVADCLESARHLVKLGITEEGPGKQFLNGGSHGGFTVAHLIGQYPDFFSAAVTRNPVTSACETSGTDIVDWYYSEFGFTFGPTSLVTPSMYEQMEAASPIHHVDKVRTPVLLLIGLADNRVPPSGHGINYYHALKGRNKTVEMLAFPKDSHPLEGVEAAKISYQAARDWYVRFSHS
jgi:acylaminoacyl-peptidase